jgi:hypothetical protein
MTLAFCVEMVGLVGGCIGGGAGDITDAVILLFVT